MPFTIAETTFGALPALAIEGDATRVVITLRGATVISWSVDGVELIDGYRDEAEFAAQLGMRSAVMIPFSNRIPAGRYVFDGVEHDLNEWDAAAAGETVMHGMLRLADFTVTGVVQNDASAIVHLASRALRPRAFAGYPFSVDVMIDLTVTASGLEFVVAGVNVGETAAPYASGWHPYFTIGDAPMERFEVTLPAGTRILMDDAYIPLDDDAAFQPTPADYDFSAPRAIGEQVLDVAFADVGVGPDGLLHTTIADPDSGRVIDVWQDGGLVHVFTADTVPRPRGSFAVEPIEVMTNAFNRPDQADAIRLEPGQRRTFRFGASTRLQGR